MHVLWCANFFFQGYGVRELSTKILQIETKKFFLDVKESRKGRFVTISEVFSSYLTLSVELSCLHLTRAKHTLHIQR